MCGIAGIVAYDDSAPVPVDARELLRMREYMAARGPDGQGEWLAPSGRVGLAHRRLAIIDLDARAAQPMGSADGSLVIVFNGEIYNYRELKCELEGRGAVFRTESDTEVLLHSYRAYGAAMVERLRGMFAFAIWDGRERSLFLARDPFGIKPLYVADDGRTLRFASQVKALVAGGAVPAETSAAGMAGFFTWGHVPEPWTWLAAVRAVPAGTTLTVRCGQRVAEPRRYFDLREEIVRAEEAAPITRDAVAQARAAVADSVQQHLVADVPVGVFLSAGRDSTLVAALASEFTGAPLRTITLGFDEYSGSADDEVPAAEKVAGLIGARHQTVRIARSDFEQERMRLLAAMDQPSIDGVNTYFVSRAAAASGLKVALSGLGGDELFGGYSSFVQVPLLARRLRLLALAPWLGRGVRLASGGLLRRVAKPKQAGLFEYGSTLAGAYLLRRSLFMPWELAELVGEEHARRGLEELRLLDDLDQRIRGIRTPAAAVMALEMSCYMRHQLLRDADWAGMAHSLEIRVPLVDPVLFRRWLPLGVRAMPFDRQQMLLAAAPRVARTVEGRPKSGFGVPVPQWLRDATGVKASEPGLRPWAKVVTHAFAPPSSRGLHAEVLLTDALGGIGGIAKFNRDLLGALDAMPECREIWAYPRLVQRQPEPVPAKVRYFFKAARGKTAYLAAVIRQCLGSRPIDLVLCGHLNLLPLAWLVSAVKRCPLLLVVHGIEAWQPHRSALVRRLLGRVDRIAAVSRYTAQRLTAWSALPADRISILPNCVDLSDFVPRERNAALARKLGIEHRRVLLTVGRLVGKERYKGFDEVLEALPVLAEHCPDLMYVIVGDGDDRPRLERKAAALGLAARVVFTGYVSEEEKKDLYALADAYAMPSRGEGFGIVYLEAMASGVPAIGSTQDGSRDALLDGKLGALVDPDDRNALVSAVREALARPRGRPPGLEHFDVAAFRARLGALVRSVAAQAPQ